MLALGYTSGWHAGELIGLRVRQLDLAASTVRLEPGTTKNGEGRTIRLTSECFELLRACMLEKQPGDFVFIRADGRPVRAYRYDREQLSARAGLGKFVCENCQAQGPLTSATGRSCRACTEVKRSSEEFTDTKGSSFTICGALPSATWSARESPGLLP